MMDQQEQFKIISEARTLTSEVKQMQFKVNALKDALKSERAEQPPTPPVCIQVPPPSPPAITPTVKFNYWAAFLPSGISLLLILVPFMFIVFMASLIWIPIYYLVIYSEKRRKEADAIQNSPAYQQQYQALLQEQQRQQEVENQKYLAAKEVYESKTLPEFEAEKQRNIAEYEQRLSEATEKLAAAEKKLAKFWTSEAAAIIPREYRDWESIKTIKNVMQDNDVDIAEAIELIHIRDQAQNEPAPQPYYEPQGYEQPPQRRSSFVRDTASVAAGVVIGNSISDKRRRKEMEELERKRQDEADRRARSERHRRAVESQIEFDRVKKLNEERRRKGQPELPLPPREWY